MWGLLLIGMALVTMGLQIRRYRARRITRTQLFAGMIARLGFLFLGIVYVTELIDRNRRLPLIGLAIVGLGIALNLVAGILENVRRARAPDLPDDDS
jgi:putative effector of murein hydrolase LrgA (UPF0299 family)